MAFDNFTWSSVRPILRSNKRSFANIENIAFRICHSRRLGKGEHSKIKKNNKNRFFYSNHKQKLKRHRQYYIIFGDF